MKVTQKAENGISESLDFQNFPGKDAPRPPNNINIYLHQILSPLSAVGVRLQPCDKTVSRKKISDGDGTYTTD